MKTQIQKFKITSTCVILLIILSVACSYAQTLLSGPQKIVVDAKRNRLLVSNYNTGDIVQIDSAGNQSYFLQNAGFVDGLEIVGDTVYGVGNNRVIKAYHLDTKQPVMNITISGLSSNYLSSIISDSSGFLMISCPNLNTIYKLKISDGFYWIYAQNNGLNKPNGMLLEREKNRIVVIDDSPEPSLIHAINLLDSSVSTLYTSSFNRPDGIVKDIYGNYYVGGYYLPGVYKFDPAFCQSPQLIYSGNNIIYPTYDFSDNSLLVTFYHANTWARVPLSTGINDPKEYVSDFHLYQNFPNPFNPSTTIKYHLTKNNSVSLKVFDLMGREIKTLVNKRQKAGDYEVSFDGSEFPSGVYLYKLETNGLSETRKMMLVK